jgi:hypothetical protein
MTNRFLLSVAAAALIAGTGFANAQGTGHMAPSAGSDAQQSTPSANAPANHSESSGGGAKSGMNKSEMNKSENNGMSREGGANQHAQQNMKGDKSTSSEMNDRSKMDKNMKAEGRKNNDMKADDRKAEEHNGMKSDSKSAADSKSSTTTTGQAGAHAKLSTEQRTKITTVIRNEHIRPETNVNFSISVGTRVPREVHFRPLPTEIVTVYPDWRGYEFFLVRDQIIVVDPHSLEIVAVLDA